jgi:flavin reductase (DIM6/NTAB) family NADH-FMN oxidoreductase RutF
MEAIILKKQMGPSDTFFPTPVVLVTSGTKENANIITVAWVGMVCSAPPTIATSMTKSRESTQMIRDYGQFTVNIPGADLVREVDYCGMVSGRSKNKFADTKLTPVQGALVGAPIIEECPYNVECKVTQEITLGEFVVFFGEIIETHIDDAFVGQSDNIVLEKANPLIYAAGLREYWSLGQKVGTAFSAGKELMAKNEIV